MTGDLERNPLLAAPHPRATRINLNVMLACLYSFLILAIMVGIVLWGIKTAENRHRGSNSR